MGLVINCALLIRKLVLLSTNQGHLSTQILSEDCLSWRSSKTKSFNLSTGMFGTLDRFLLVYLHLLWFSILQGEIIF